MANKRKYLDINQFSQKTITDIGKVYDQIGHTIITLYEEAKLIQDTYWRDVKSVTKQIYDQNKLSIVKRSGDDLSQMTFILYAPSIRLDTNKSPHVLSMYWGKAKYGQKIRNKSGKDSIGRKSDHVSMRTSTSAYMPGRYEKNQFKYNQHNIWQQKYVLEAEKKLAELRVIVYKLNLSYSDLKYVLENVDNRLNKHDAGEDSTNPTLAENLAALNKALHRLDMDPNKLSKSEGQLLINTSDEELARYGINPEIKETYFFD